MRRAAKVLTQTSDHLCALKLNRQMVLILGLREVGRGLIGQAHRLGLPVIMDAKLNDIGYTNEAVANLYYSAGFDAVIASPFVGWEDGLEPLLRTARKQRRGVLMLCYMSHTGASATYGATVKDPNDGRPKKFYRLFAEKSLEWKPDGLVVGATSPSIIKEVSRIVHGRIPIFSPGVGIQGGTPREARRAGADYLIVGRSIYQAADPAAAAKRFAVLSQ